MSSPSHRVDVLGVSYRGAKRLVVLVVGCTMVLIGVLLLVLPGPGLLVIFLGLTLLASEFVWARRWLTHLREKSRSAGNRAVSWWRKRPSKDV